MTRAQFVSWFRWLGFAALSVLLAVGPAQAQTAFERLSRASQTCPEPPPGGTTGDWEEGREREVLALAPQFASFEQALDKELPLSRTQMDRDRLMRCSIFGESLGNPFQPPVPFREARDVASKAIFCGWLRLAQGEPLTAIRRDLQALRVGMELLRSSTILVEAMTGVSIERSAWESLSNKLMDAGFDSAQFQKASAAIREMRSASDFRVELVQALDRSSDCLERMVRSTVGQVAEARGQVDEAIRLMREYDGGVRECLREDIRLVDGCVTAHVKRFLAAGHHTRNRTLAKCLANYGGFGARVADTFAMREMILAALMLAEFRVTQGRPPRDSNELKGLTLDPLSRCRTRSIMKPEFQILGMSGHDGYFDSYDPARDLVAAPRALRRKFKILATYVKPLTYRQALIFQCPGESASEPVQEPCETARLQLGNGVSGLRAPYGLTPACDLYTLQHFLVANRLMYHRVRCRDGGVLSLKDGEVSCSGHPKPVAETPVPTTVSVWGTASCSDNLAVLEIAVKFFNIDNNTGLTDLSEQTQAKMIAGGYIKAGARCPDGGAYTLDGWHPRCSKHPNSESSASDK